MSNKQPERYALCSSPACGKQFWRDNAGQKYCPDCRCGNDQESKEAMGVYQKAYYQKNKEKAKAYQKACRQKYKEKFPTKKGVVSCKADKQAIHIKVVGDGRFWAGALIPPQLIQSMTAEAIQRNWHKII